MLEFTERMNKGKRPFVPTISQGIVWIPELLKKINKKQNFQKAQSHFFILFYLFDDWVN